MRPLSQSLAALPALPKGEPRALPKAFSLHLKLQQQASDLGSPFGRAGAGAPERAYAKSPGERVLSGAWCSFEKVRLFADHKEDQSICLLLGNGNAKLGRVLNTSSMQNTENAVHIFLNFSGQALLGDFLIF